MIRPAATGISAVMLSLFVALRAMAAVEASWQAVTLDENGNPETIQGYHIYYGTQAGGPYPQGFSTGNVLTTVVNDLAGGQTYYFVVTAIDMAGNESAYSNEASYTVPSEICDDGQDNDGDGNVDCRDPDCASLPAPACPLQTGVCAGATRPCDNDGRFGQCTASSYGPNYEATESRCDGRDNDCDGQTDEMPGPACPLQSGVCRNSRQPCLGNAGWGACDYGADYQSSEDRCDDLDNDCDGSVDEGCPCTPNETAPCSTDEGECQIGTQTCNNSGQWGPCSGVLPTAETCDGLDNDCDGQTDEDNVCAADGGDAGPDGGDPGTDTGADAGADSGPSDGEVLIEGGCGCGAAGASLTPALLLGLALTWRRRVRFAA